ncbi:glycosyltransferase family 4 protein [Candidatus Saccharibacteria bacterium]|nr:glycosyltransferase family 4 protein [Candidatus Saccharibacteria bacterium]
MKSKIAWLVPDFNNVSGGHRTIFSNFNYLVSQGYICDLYVNSLTHESPELIVARISKDYGALKGTVHTGYELEGNYDAIVATSWDTVEAVAGQSAGQKLYFIQDFEPWFFPMSDDYLSAERSYTYGLKGITIGHWLANKIGTNYPMNASSFDFCADLTKYRPLKSIKKEKAICYIFQPNKPRRGHKIALRALQIVQKIHPDVKIYLYGSEEQEFHNLQVENLGVIPVERCNELYNKCTVGLCMSLSNPSRIPFEMMAAGLPVVELYRENNLYDLPEQGCFLAEPSPEAVATALLKLLENNALRDEMSSFGYRYMQKFPLEKGYEQFLKFVNQNLSNKSAKKTIVPPKRIYRRAAVKPKAAIVEVSANLPEKVSYNPIPLVAPAPPPKPSVPRRVVNKAKSILRRSNDG